MKKREVARLAKVLCARAIENALDSGAMLESELLTDDDATALEQECWRIADDLYDRGSVVRYGGGGVVTMRDAMNAAGVRVDPH